MEFKAFWEEIGLDVHIEVTPGNKISKVELSFPNPNTPSLSAKEMPLLDHLRHLYLSGIEASDFDYFDLSGISSFQKTIYLELIQIPRGTTISYGNLAKKAGKPKASRAVGTAMAKNPIPLIIPCHRVVRHNGDIGHYAFGQEIKQRLLDLEES